MTAKIEDEIPWPKIHQQRNKPHKPSDWTYYSDHAGPTPGDEWSGDPLAYDGRFIYESEAQEFLWLRKEKETWFNRELELLRQVETLVMVERERDSLRKQNKTMKMAAEMILQIEKDRKEGQINTFEEIGLMLAPMALFRQVLEEIEK